MYSPPGRKLKLAESHANDIEALLIETEGGEKRFKNPVSCFDNFLWERYNGDLLGYETQLRCGKLELEAAKNALEKAELNLNEKIEQLLEIDIEKSALLLKSLELKEDNLSLLNVNQVKEALNKVKILVLESFNKETELDFYEDDSFKTNKLYNAVRAKASLDLSKLQEENKLSNFNLEDPIINDGVGSLCRACIQHRSARQAKQRNDVLLVIHFERFVDGNTLSSEESGLSHPT